MPLIIECPSCKQDVSAHAIDCQKCGTSINEVPHSVTVEVLASLRDVDLPMFLYWYAEKFLGQNGCYQIDGPPSAALLAKLPRGIRVGYTLVVLISEIENGGFFQWFTNSSGTITHETLDDLRLIGATAHVQVVEKAISLNNAIEEKYPSYKNRWKVEGERGCRSASDDELHAELKSDLDPEFDTLSDEICSLEETDSIWSYFTTFVRQHAAELVHQRN